MSEQKMSGAAIGSSARQQFNRLLAPPSKRGFLKHVACLAIFFLIRQLLADQLQDWKLVQEEKAHTYSTMMRNALLGTHLVTSSVWAQEQSDQLKETTENDKEDLVVEEDIASIKMNNVVWDDSSPNDKDSNEKSDSGDEEIKNENEVGEPRTEEEGSDDAAKVMMEQIMKAILGQAMGGLDLGGLGEGKLDMKQLLQQILSKGKPNGDMDLSALEELFGDLSMSDDAEEELASEQPAIEDESAATSESSSTVTTTTESPSTESQKSDAQDSPKDEL